MDAEILFDEKQRFTQWWIWLSLLLLAAFAINDGDLEGITVAVVLLLFAVIRLETQIKPDGVYVRFFPFHIRYRRFLWEDIERFSVERYSPVFKYGGWGIRLGKNCKAYSVGGRMGLHLHLKNGKLLLIGTRKPDEMQRVLTEIKK